MSKEMLESSAYRELVRHRGAFVVTWRIALEHMCHAGKENGRLKVTYSDFQDWGGISPRQVVDGIAIAEHLGFIKQTKQGLASFEDRRYPNEYALTWQPVKGELPTNEWRKVWSLDVAKAKVIAAMRHRREERQANKGRTVKRTVRPPRRMQVIAAS
jgi:hypothetical protein